MHTLRPVYRVLGMSLCLALLAFFAFSGVLPGAFPQHAPNNTALAAPINCPPPLTPRICEYLMLSHVMTQPQPCPPPCGYIFDPRKVWDSRVNPGPDAPYLVGIQNTAPAPAQILNSAGAVVATVNPNSTVVFQVPNRSGTYYYTIAGSQMGEAARLEVTVGLAAGG